MVQFWFKRTSYILFFKIEDIINASLKTIFMKASFSVIEYTNYLLYFFFCLDNPLIGKIVPSVIVTVDRHTVSLSCYSITKPYWSTAAGNIPVPVTHIRFGGYRMIMHTVSRFKSGRYYCDGTKQGGEKFRAHADIYIGGKLIL